MGENRGPPGPRTPLTQEVDTTPADGGTIPRGTPVTIKASVASTDKSAITQVDYYADKQKVATTTGANAIAQFTAKALGKLVLTTIATSNNGLSTASAPVVVETTGTAPGGTTPTVTVATAGTGTVSESGGQAKIVFTRGGDTSAALTVRFKLKGSARNGTDYKKLATSVVIPAGQTHAVLKVKAVNDHVVNGTRRIILKLAPSVDGSYAIGSPSTIHVDFLDSD